MEIFRGSWIPASDHEGNQRFFCPFCGQMVYMFPKMATYPTCPWCVTDMPEMDDFETPEELDYIKALEPQRKVERKPAPVTDEEKRARRRERYQLTRNQSRAYQRSYYYEHRDQMTEGQKERNRQNARRYREAHHDEILAKARADRAANPEKYREYSRRYKEKHKNETDTRE